MADPLDCRALHLTANKVHHVTLSFVLHRIVPNKPIFAEQPTALKNELAIQPHLQNSHSAYDGIFATKNLLKTTT